MEALHIRERYMRVSHQSFPTITSKFFHKKHHKTQDDTTTLSSGNASVHLSSDNIADTAASSGGQSTKSKIKQPYPSARIIKHEDRQSIAGESRNFVVDHNNIIINIDDVNSLF